MAPKKKKSPKQEIVHGTGAVSYRFNEGESGPIQINVDFALAPIPQSYYYADAIDLRVDTDLLMAILSFGRREIGTNRFADRLDIVMPAASLFRYFWQSSRTVEATVDEIMERLKVRLQAFPASAGSSPAMTLFANMIHVAVGEGDSILDFYYLPARDVHLAKTRKLDMQVQPIVRIILSSVLAKYFFGLLLPHVQDTDASQPAEWRKEHATVSR